MKRTLLALGGALAMLVGCTDKNAYTLTANVPNEFSGQTVVLFSPENGDTLGTAVVSDTIVTFKGSAETPRLVMLTCQGIPMSAPFVVESGTITLTDDGATGTPSNDDFMALQEMALADDTDGIALASKFVSEHPSNPYNYWLLRQFGYMFSPEAISEYISANPNKANDPMLNSLLSAATNRTKTSKGGNYIDFEGKDADGNEQSLASYVMQSKYTILDFWAPWCGPCCREIPTLEKLYEKYKGQGLTVVGAEVWRRNGSDPYAEVKELGVTYPILYDVDQRVTDEYGVLAIPAILVIDKEGTIVARDIMGEELTACVDSIMK